MILSIFIFPIRISNCADFGCYDTNNPDEINISDFLSKLDTILSVDDADSNRPCITDKNSYYVNQSDNSYQSVTDASHPCSSNVTTADSKQSHKYDQLTCYTDQNYASMQPVSGSEHSYVSNQYDPSISNTYISNKNTYDNNNVYHDSVQCNIDMTHSHDINQVSNNLNQPYNYHQYASNTGQLNNPLQYDYSSSQSHNYNQPINSLNHSNTSTHTHTNYNLMSENTNFDSQNKANQSIVHTDSSNTSGIDNGLSYQTSVSEVHIDFMTLIIENIKADCVRIPDGEIQKDILVYFYSECTQFLEEIKKFNLQNSKPCTSKIITDKPSIFSKNLNISEETKLFLDFLSSLNPNEDIDGSRTKYYQKLFSYINSRIHKMSYASNYDSQSKAALLEENNKNIKKRKLEEVEEANEIENKSSNKETITLSHHFIFKRALFSKNFFYLLYYDRITSSAKLLRFKYKNNLKAGNFSVENIDLETKQTLKLTQKFKSIFLDSDGTLFVHSVHKSLSSKFTNSCIKKIDEENFNYNIKIDENKDLLLTNIVIDKFMIHSGRIYLLDVKNKKVLIYTTDFEKKNEIKFEIDLNFKNNERNLLFAIQEHIVIIFGFRAFIWKIDSESDKFEETRSGDIFKISFYNYVFSQENKFLCKHSTSQDVCICKIENIENSPFFKFKQLNDLPLEIGRKNCELFKFLDGEIYCAFLNGEDPEIEKNLKIKNYKPNKI